MTFGAAQHCSLLLVLSSLLVDHSSFTVALHERVRLSNKCSLRRSQLAAQLNVGNRRTAKGGTERYDGLWRAPLEPTTSVMGLGRAKKRPIKGVGSERKVCGLPLGCDRSDPSIGGLMPTIFMMHVK